MKIITHIQDWYSRFERPISSIALIGGFVFNVVALKRVDLFWENFWVVIHLGIVAICIVLINLYENNGEQGRVTAMIHFWSITVLQFTFGGLLSTFLVFYFRSATLAVTWPFILILIIAFIANERLKQHYTRLTFQISLFFLSLFTFAIFIIPVFLHQIGDWVFLLSGLSSILVLRIFLFILKRFAKEKFQKSRKMLIFYIATIFIIVNVLYFFRLIPPIPLSLKDGGIYHSISRTNAGDYLVTSESTTWFENFLSPEIVRVVPGDLLYAYSAIFSPTAFHTDIVHEWQWRDPQTKKWITMNRVDLSLLGGREGGYRTYSIKSNIAAGQWRVNVETNNGQVIGRLRFDISMVSTEPILHKEIKK